MIEDFAVCVQEDVTGFLLASMECLVHVDIKRYRPLLVVLRGTDNLTVVASRMPYYDCSVLPIN